MDVRKHSSTVYSRILEYTESSDKNYEMWCEPTTLVFSTRLVVLRTFAEYMKEYCQAFNEQYDYCLDTLFQDWSKLYILLTLYRTVCIHGY